MLDDFLTRACLAGIGVALAAGPLGCFVVWRAHRLFRRCDRSRRDPGRRHFRSPFRCPIVIGVLAAAVAMAVAVSTLSERGLAMDTLLGVASHGSLAVGLVAVAVASPRAIDVEAYLFGEILAVTRTDLAVIWSGAAVVLGLVVWRWPALLTATLSPELARGGGIDPQREQLILTIAIAVLVAVSIKVVGALLITAMLIIPAAAARPVSGTPERMAAAATLIAVASVFAGLAASWRWGHAHRPQHRDPGRAVLRRLLLARRAPAESGLTRGATASSSGSQ